LYGDFIGCESQLTCHEHHIPEGVIVSAKTIMTNAYMAILLAILVWGPLFALHGYRQWWCLMFYAVVAAGTIGGITSRYLMPPRNGHS
jgi:uncharacterized membrane protein